MRESELQINVLKRDKAIKTKEKSGTIISYFALAFIVIIFSHSLLFL